MWIKLTDTPWEDLKFSDYRALLDEAKRQIQSFA